MVELGGIEPPSESTWRKASTGVVVELILVPGRAHDRLSEDQPGYVSCSSILALVEHQPYGVWHLRSGLWGVHRASVATLVARLLLLITKQRERRYDCYWQLYLCWFLSRTVQPRGLQLWPCHLRRNQGNPVKEERSAADLLRRLSGQGLDWVAAAWWRLRR